MAYCHFELCHDYGLGCFSELLLADIRRLSVVAVVFLYQISSVVNKDLTLKAKAKDLTHKAKAKDLPSRTNPRTALFRGGTDSNYFSILKPKKVI